MRALIPLSFILLPSATLACTAIVLPGASIQASIAAVSQSGGGDVCLAPGVHTTSGIDLMTGVRLRGQSSDRTAAVLQLVPGANRHVIEAWSNVSSSIADITVDGAGSQQAPGSSAGIAIESSNDVRVENVVVRNTDIMNAIVRNSSYVSILNSTFELMDMNSSSNAYSAIWIGDTGFGGNNWVWIGDNVINGRGNGPGGDGSIDCYGSDNVAIYRNQINNAGPSAIYLAFGATAGHGCRDSNVWSNNITNAGEWGIDIVGGSSNVFVGSNTINGAYFGAMVVWQASAVTMQYNVMQNANQSGYAACRGVNVRASSGVSVDTTNYVDSGPRSCNY